MANRLYARDHSSLEKYPVFLWAKVSIGASGAPTISTANSKGIKSIVRNSTGDYTLTLTDPYYKLLDFAVWFNSSTGIPAATCVGTKGTIAVTTTSAPTIEFVCSTAGGGSATDPGSGETMYIKVVVSNSAAL